jgi:hypothetical protein
MFYETNLQHQYIMERGVLYIASGLSYIEDAVESAESVKSTSDLPITLVADREVPNPVFDTVLHSDDFCYHYGDSVLKIPSLPYEKTLLLDTDTVVTEGFQDLFELSENLDIAAAPVAEKRFRIPTVPDSFPELNTGVVLFNKDTKTSRFITLWKEIYKDRLDNGTRMNQPAFREALYKSPVKSVTLSTEYNCRANFGGYLTDEVKILHGDIQDPQSIFEQLNEHTTPRVFFNKNDQFHVEQVNTTNNRFRS